LKQIGGEGRYFFYNCYNGIREKKKQRWGKGWVSRDESRRQEEEKGVSVTNKRDPPEEGSRRIASNEKKR